MGDIAMLRLENIIEAQQFSRDWLEDHFFPSVIDLERRFKTTRRLDSLKGKGMISFFYEPSTRTRASFEIAMRKMGGDVIFSTENAKEFSSVVKGETLEDTMRVLNRYGPDVIVSRFANEGDAEKASKVSSVPVINAGDGCGQHPTQALLDIYTIQKKFDFIDGLTIAMAGDLAKGRTVRSLCYLLGKFKNVLVYFVSPDNSKMRDDIKDYLKEHNVQFRECPSLQEIASKVDVIYQTRPQKERGTVFDLSEDARKHFTVDERIVREMSERSIIMHPLPRTGEITLEVDKDPRAVYLTDQIDSGLFTRMALLKMLCS
jgi:aspartate carbamoyltransferase catalytic subunit